jgi:hypothetical protein
VGNLEEYSSQATRNDEENAEGGRSWREKFDLTHRLHVKLIGAPRSQYRRKFGNILFHFRPIWNIVEYEHIPPPLHKQLQN